MLAVLLKILSIIGIILLVLLCILVAALVMVLFIPLVYHVDGRKDPETLVLHGRIRWLFGFLSVVAQYSSGVHLKVKLLCFTLFDLEKNISDTEEKPRRGKPGKTAPGKTKKSTGIRERAAAEKSTENRERAVSEEGTVSQEKAVPETGSKSQEQTDTAGSPGSSGNVKNAAHEDSLKEESGIYAKFEKIKYKIKTIYDNIKEKIKDVLENIAYYKSLLEDKETRALFHHVRVRAGKVLKALKPKKYQAEILFGTGSPDTTGYALGIYGMLSPHLGNDIIVTPDFTRAVLEGQFAMSGHIMVFTILIQGLGIVLDKNFHLFMDKINQK